MRGQLEFDPTQRDYGPATGAIRQIFREWTAIDWFVPPRDEAAKLIATRLFEQHAALVRAHLPEAYPGNVEMRFAEGGIREFTGLCKQFQDSPSGSWDWKYGVLKKLSYSHSTALGWRLDTQADGCISAEEARQSTAGALFMRLGDHVMWIAQGPKLDLEAVLPADQMGSVRWYLSYADMDMTESIEWQLAEKSDRLEGNPFIPLMRCYAAGFYPFCFGPNMVTLFAFDRA